MGLRILTFHFSLPVAASNAVSWPRAFSQESIFKSPPFNAGGERTAAIYSLAGSAKLIGPDPSVYLRHAMERIADHPICRIDVVLPWRVDFQSDHANRLAA
jgi:hypothetical protein